MQPYMCGALLSVGANQLNLRTITGLFNTKEVQYKMYAVAKTAVDKLVHDMTVFLVKRSCSICEV